ncbi:membrane protein [Actinomycetospora corticicola]|uniref:DUF2269 domain-containing protein n=1 Tax=Actinomycetospora corticicola TaxID=663602 RepID=A0A7Y9DTQ0_9PSEU|nr:hypothetical protein [Actinomycetospora corticicola]NYD35219.1 hypothetical protein [Actinomycetospora corticicola]
MPVASLVGKRTRQLLVFVHVVVSLGWMGAGAANVVLTSTAAVTDDVELRRACYLLVSTIDLWLVIPGAFLALATGVVLSLVTPWGLVTYWWVLVKLVLTVAVILYSTFFVGVWVEQSVALGTSPSPVAVPLVVGPLVSMAAFLLMTWASVAKPWGRTPWRRRTSTRVLAAA